MKTILIAMSVVAVTGLGIGLVACLREDAPSRPNLSSVPSPAAVETEGAVPAATAVPDRADQVAPTPRTGASRVPSRAANAPVQPPAPQPGEGLAPVLTYALHPGTPYLQRQAVWNQLRDAGLLDDAMKELEKRAQDEPSNAAIPASLGQLGLLKASTITNSIAEQGLLGLKADKSFDSALNLDPANWEARFWKAAAMSYWPAVLHKSGDVIENFAQLVQQQESQAPQPQFAQTYVLLGQEYMKLGDRDHAGELWQRGLQLFPDDNGLKDKLASLEK